MPTTTVPHRFVTPTYPNPSTLVTPATGTLISGQYDLFNVVSGSTGAGGTPPTPAYMSTAKSGGQNAGTYGIAYQDDATENNANRPSLALVQNTDFLDNLLHRPIAGPIRTGDATVGGSPLTSLVLPAGTFLGALGTPATPLNTLFEITDTNDDEILVSSAECAVTYVALTGGDSSTTVFSANSVTLTISPGIPAGQAYRVYYATQTSLADMPVDALSTIKIRGAAVIDAVSELLFAQLHGNGLAWNASWTSTIYDLTTQGLDGAYRHSTTGGITELNTPGAGASITRDGAAPNVVGEQTSRTYLDTYNQLHAALAEEVGADRATYPIGSGGYLFMGQHWDLEGSAPSTQPTPSLFSFASITERVNAIVAGSPGAGHGYATKIAPGASAAIFTTATAGVFKVVLSSGYFYNSTTNETAVAVGRDYLECELGGVGDFAFVIVALDYPADPTIAYVATLDGGTLAAIPSPGPTTISVTWATPRLVVGESANTAKEAFTSTSLGAYAFADNAFFSAPPSSPLTRDTADVTGAWKQNFVPTAAYFGGDVDYITTTQGSALSWGSLQRDLTGSNPGQWQELGKLFADGSFLATAGHVTGVLQADNLNAVCLGTNGLTVSGTGGISVAGSGSFALSCPANLFEGLNVTGATTGATISVTPSTNQALAVTGTSAYHGAATFDVGVTTLNHGLVVGSAQPTTFNSTVTYAGAANAIFNNNATFNSGFEVTADVAMFDAGINVTAGTSTFGGPVVADDGLTVSSTGNTTINNPAALAHGVVISGGALQLSGASAYTTWRSEVFTSNGNESLTLNQDTFFATNATTNACTYTITVTPSTGSPKVRLVVTDAGGAQTLVANAGALSVYIPAGKNGFIEYMFSQDASPPQWIIHDWSAQATFTGGAALDS